MVKESSAVQVALRIRPLTEKDRAQPRFANLSNDDILKIHERTVHVVPHNKLFTFDHVFGVDSTQSQVFEALGEKLIHKFVEGYNVTILAYGQTSSGKTYTMGTAQHQSGRYNMEQEGIVPRAMALLFDNLNSNSNQTPDVVRSITPTPSRSSSTTDTNITQPKNRLRPPSRRSHVPSPSTTISSHTTSAKQQQQKYTIKVSFVEIYNEELNDLLNGAPSNERPAVNIREDAKGHIYWTGVKELPVYSTDDVLFHLEQGTRNRATGATDMNDISSRSHAIFSVSLKHEKWVPAGGNTNHSRTDSPVFGRKRSGSSIRAGGVTSLPSEDGEWMITNSKFHFVDLAGSERLKRTAAEGDRRKEGININAGLLALGNVISALGDPSKRGTHVPYRDSKLTRLLQDSLGGSATTLMIACASPTEYNLSETLNTLQYANRARNIKNRVEKNEVEEWMTTDNIELLRTMIGKLKTDLRNFKSGSMSSSSVASTVVASPTHNEHDLITNGNDSDQLYQEQRLAIADLQRQVEELDGEASVTRERNKVVETELKRVRKLESMRKKEEELKMNNNLDFQHLVEPVIEEYEKSISALESQLSIARAALNHSDIGFEEQRAKLEQCELMLENQDQTVSDLRTRLSKLQEREHNNETYIDELEGKLMRSANDALRDQDLLNELKTRITRFKETDENTEQYIFDLEQRLATSEADKITLQKSVESLESKMTDVDTTNAKLRSQLNKAEDSTTEKMILQELDEVTKKCKSLEDERDQLNIEVERLSAAAKLEQQQQSDKNKQNQQQKDLSNENKNSNSNMSDVNGQQDRAARRQTYRRSYADEMETPESAAAMNIQKAERRAEEATARALHLERELRELQDDHHETCKELDEVLMRYQESLDQVDLMQQQEQKRRSLSAIKNSNQDSNGNDHHATSGDEDSADEKNGAGGNPNALGKEMLRAKEVAETKERETRIERIKELEKHVHDLQEQLDQRQADLKNVQHEFEQHKATALQENRVLETKYQRQVETLNDTIQQLKTEHQSSLKRLQQELIDEKNMRDRGADEQKDELQKRYDVVQSEFDNLKVSSDAALSDTKQKNEQDMQKLHEQVTDLQQQVADYKKTVGVQDKHIQDLNQQLNQLNQDLTKAREVITGLELESSKHVDVLQRSLSDNKKLETKMSGADEHHQSRVRILEEQLRTTQSSLTTSTDENKQLQQEIDQHRARIEQQSIDAQQRLQALEKHCADQASVIDSLRQSVDTANMDLESKTKNLDAVKVGSDALEKQRVELTSGIQLLKDQLANAEAKVRELEIAKIEAIELSKQCGEQAQFIDTLQSQLKELTVSSTSKDLKAQQEIDSLRDDANNLETQRQELTIAIETLRQQLKQTTHNNSLTDGDTTAKESDASMIRMASLEQKCNEQLILIESLEAQLHKSTQTMDQSDTVYRESIEQQRKQLTAAIESLHAQLCQTTETADNNLDIKMKELDVIKNSTTRLEKQCANQASMIDSLQAQLQQKDITISDSDHSYQKQVESFEQKCNEQASTIESLQERLREKQKNSNNNKNVDRSISSKQDPTAENKNLEEFKNKADKLQKQCKDQSIVIEDLKLQLLTVTSSSSAKQQQQSRQLEVNHVDDNVQVTELQTRCNNLEASLKEKDEQIDALQQDLDNVDEALAELEEQKRIADEDGLEKLKLLDDVAKENDELATRLKSLESEFSNTKKQYIDHSKLLAEAIKEKDIIQSKLHETERSMHFHKNDLTTQLKTLEKEFVDAKERYDEQSKLLSETNKKKESIESKLKQMEVSFASAQEGSDEQSKQLAQKINQLEQQAQEYQRNIEQREKNIAQLEAEAVNTKKALETTRKQLYDLRHASAHDKQHYSDELIVLQDQLQEMTKQLEQEKKQSKRLDTELASSRAIIESEQQKHQREIEQAMEKSKRESKEQLGLLTQQEKRNDTLKVQLKAAQDTTQEKDAHLRSLRSQVETHVHTISDLRDELEKLKFLSQAANTNNNNGDVHKLYEERMDQLEKKAKQLEDENQEYITLSEELEGEVSRLMKEVDQLTQELNANHESNDDQLQQLQESLETMESTYQRQLDQVNDEITESRTKYVERERELNDKIQELQGEIVALKEKASSSAAAAVATQQQQDDKTKVVKNDDDGVKQHQKELNKLKIALTTAEANVKHHQSNIQGINSKLQTTQMTLQNVQQELTSKSQENETLQQSILTNEEINQKLKIELADAKKAKDKAERSLATLENQLEELISKKSKFMCF